MRDMVLRAGACALLAIVLSGCSYVGNRVADLSDIFAGELTFGPGIDVHAEATSMFGTSMGLSKQWGLMMQGRHVGMGGRNTDGIVVIGSSDVSGDVLVPVYGDEHYEPRMRGRGSCSFGIRLRFRS